MERKMKDSGIPWIGMIPNDWNVVRTKNVFACSKSLVGEDWSHTQLLSLTTRGVKEVAIGSTSGKVPNSYETYQVVNKDNLVMCLFDLDCSAVFSGVSNFHGMISPAYKVLKTLDGFYPAFYGYWFDYIFDGRKYKYLSKNIRYSMTYDEFAALGIAAPTLPTQQLIADFLNRKCAEIDELAALQETMIAELKRYKQSVITEAVTKGLNTNVPMKDSGVEWIGEIPKGWVVRAIKTMATLKSGSNITTNDIKEEKIGFPVYGGNGLRGYYSEYSDDGDYALIGRQGALCGNINYAHGKFWATDHCVVCYPKTEFVLTWFGETLRTMNLNQYSLSCAQPGLSVERIKEKLMPVPPLTEQRTIADYLDQKCAEIDELIAIKQQKIEALKEYKKSVIFEYVTGKKEVL